MLSFSAVSFRCVRVVGPVGSLADRVSFSVSISATTSGLGVELAFAGSMTSRNESSEGSLSVREGTNWTISWKERMLRCTFLMKHGVQDISVPRGNKRPGRKQMWHG